MAETSELPFRARSASINELASCKEASLRVRSLKVKVVKLEYCL